MVDITDASSVNGSHIETTIPEATLRVAQQLLQAGFRRVSLWPVFGERIYHEFQHPAGYLVTLSCNYPKPNRLMWQILVPQGPDWQPLAGGPRYESPHEYYDSPTCRSDWMLGPVLA